MRHSWKKGIFEVGFGRGRGVLLEPSPGRERKKFKGKEGREDPGIRSSEEMGCLMGGRSSCLMTRQGERWRFAPSPALLCHSIWFPWEGTSVGTVWAGSPSSAIWLPTHLTEGIVESQFPAGPCPDVAVSRGVRHLPFLG